MPYQNNYVMQSFFLCGVKVLHLAQIIYKLIANCDRPPKKKRKKRYPGCLAHAVSGMFYSVVANLTFPFRVGTEWYIRVS